MKKLTGSNLSDYALTSCWLQIDIQNYLHALVADASMHLLTIRRSSARGRRFSQLWSTAIESARFCNITSERKTSVLDTKLFSPKDSVISKYSAAHLNTATLEGVISKLMP